MLFAPRTTGFRLTFLAAWFGVFCAPPAVHAQVVHYPVFIEPDFSQLDASHALEFELSTASEGIPKGSCVSVSRGVIRHTAADGSVLAEVRLRDEPVSALLDRVRGRVKGVEVTSDVEQLHTRYVGESVTCAPLVANKVVAVPIRSALVQVITSAALASTMNSLADEEGSSLLKAAGLKTDIVAFHRPAPLVYASARLGFRSSTEREELGPAGQLQGKTSVDALLENAEYAEFAVRLDLGCRRGGVRFMWLIPVCPNWEGSGVRFGWSLDAGVSVTSGSRIVVDSIEVPGFGLTIGGVDYVRGTVLGARDVFGDQLVNKTQAELDENRARFSYIVGPTLSIGDNLYGGYLSTGVGHASVPKAFFSASCGGGDDECDSTNRVLNQRSLRSRKETRWRARYRVAVGVFASGFLVAGEASGPVMNSGPSNVRFLVSKGFPLG